jgi:hypothetical protein
MFSRVHGDRSSQQEAVHMHASEVTPEAVERANDLYWHSDRSVNQIADELDLSKGALYGILEPEPSGLGCPLCGDEVGYPNRTAKERATLECPTCTWEGSDDQTISYAEGGGVGDMREEGSPEVSDADGDVPAAGATRLPQSAPTPLSTVVGGALLGGAVGLALVMWARRR